MLARGSADPSIWESTLVTPTTTIMPVLADHIVRALIAELERPKEPGDTHQHAANRREAALRQQFATLSPHESLALQRRLEIGAIADELVIAFLRLVPERRARLLAYLADVRLRRG